MTDRDHNIRKTLKYISLALLTALTILGLTQLLDLTPEFEAIAQPPNIANSRSEIRGVWMTNNDLDVMRDRRRLQESLTRLRQMNFNTIYPVVWNSGYAMFPSPTARETGIQPFLFKGTEGQDILGNVVAQAHKVGLLVIPWFEFGFMTPPTSELAINRPGWLTKKRDRSTSSISEDGEVVWLNPFHPEVQDFITKLVLEVVTNYDVDGVQFDDHMSLPKEFGYDDYTIALYKKEALLRIKACQIRRSLKPIPIKKPKPTAKSSPQPVAPPVVPPLPCNVIPLEVPLNADHPAWVQWRADKITEFMTRLNKAVKQRKPQAIFSISPNHYEFAYKAQLQDWLGWVRRNIVDELIVQTYRADLASFTSLIDRPEIKEAQQKTLTGIAILTGLRSTPVSIRQIQPQVRVVMERNLGMAFFYFNSLWGYGPEPTADRQSQFQLFLRRSSPN